MGSTHMDVRVPQPNASSLVQLYLSRRRIDDANQRRLRLLAHLFIISLRAVLIGSITDPS